jgi:hypothetical protein
LNARAGAAVFTAAFFAGLAAFFVLTAMAYLRPR